MTISEKAIRLYLEEEQLRRLLEEQELPSEQALNLFWVKEGRVFCFANCLAGEQAARVYRLLQEIRPVQELEGEYLVSLFVGAEEAFLIKDDKVFSVRQIGKVQLGNVRLLAKLVSRYVWAVKN